MPRVNLSLALIPALLLLAACEDSNGARKVVELRDDCDPATFNAALGAGTCQRASTGVTLANFTAELQANQAAAAWVIVPTNLEVDEGTSLPVMNTGGEVHTYTEVENFGGGVVPMLNQLSGNTTVAPECADQSAFTRSTVRAGETMQHTFDEKGTEKYQCCIHPWMRQTVTVR
jgi:plastocyanin